MNTAILIGGPLNGEPRTFAETGYPSTLIISRAEWSRNIVYNRTDEYIDERRVYRYQEPSQGMDRDFWISIRDSLLETVRMIEERMDVGGDHAV
jgi:hypothetical protein